MAEWGWILVVGGVVLGLVSVIFGLLVQRLNRVEAAAAGSLSRAEHEHLCTERSERVERQLAELQELIRDNHKTSTDRRHSMDGRLVEICQRLAMIEAVKGDPRLRRNDER